jgi:periplasmic protein TonB
MSSLLSHPTPRFNRPYKVIIFVLASLLLHAALVIYTYQSGLLTVDDIDSIPTKTIRASLQVPIVEEIPPTPPKPVEIVPIKKKKIVTQAPSVKKVAVKPKPVKKKPQPVAVKKPAASPLPSPIKKPIVFSTPQPSYQPKPKYPSIARRRGVEGIVIFEISVANNGHVNQAFIIESSGSSALDKAAMQAIKTWRFPPSQFNSLSNFKQKIEFRLNAY